MSSRSRARRQTHACRRKRLMSRCWWMPITNLPIREMMEHIVKSLKPGGRVIQIEYRGEDASVPIKSLHKMTVAQARKEMEAVGLRWQETQDFLPYQHFIVFVKP